MVNALLCRAAGIIRVPRSITDQLHARQRVKKVKATKQKWNKLKRFAENRVENMVNEKQSNANKALVAASNVAAGPSARPHKRKMASKNGKPSKHQNRPSANPVENVTNGNAATGRAGGAAAGMGAHVLLSRPKLQKAMRRIMAARKAVREQRRLIQAQSMNCANAGTHDASTASCFDELVYLREATKVLFQEIDAALMDARDAERSDMEKRVREQKDAIAWLESEQRRLAEEEREKTLCMICLERARDTLVLPCLHFQYCLECLLQHRHRNGNTCPACRISIQGFCMASSLGTGQL